MRQHKKGYSLPSAQRGGLSSLPQEVIQPGCSSTSTPAPLPARLPSSLSCPNTYNNLQNRPNIAVNKLGTRPITGNLSQTHFFLRLFLSCVRTKLRALFPLSLHPWSVSPSHSERFTARRESVQHKCNWADGRREGGRVEGVNPHFPLPTTPTSPTPSRSPSPTRYTSSLCHPAITITIIIHHR